MRDLDLTTLRLFVAVCETGNIARAGEQASIVGSAISKRLSQLEAQLGTSCSSWSSEDRPAKLPGYTTYKHYD